MSIIIGITKQTSEEEKERLKPFISSLVDSGYVRRIVAHEGDYSIQSFSKEDNPIFPAYIVDKMVKGTSL